MPDFTCKVCSKSFSIPQEALEKYPGWEPKYCREHSPKKKTEGTSGKPSGEAATKPRSFVPAVEELLTLEEVLATHSGGPQSGIFTDGSARPNPGPGGWGCVLVLDGKPVAQKHGRDPETTNNRMELTGLIEALKLVEAHKISVPLTMYTDSELCVNILNKWADGWAKNGWKRKSGPIANLDLVQELYRRFRGQSVVTIEWIKAHNGWLWNEYADSLSTAWLREKL